MAPGVAPGGKGDGPKVDCPVGVNEGGELVHRFQWRPALSPLVFPLSAEEELASRCPTRTFDGTIILDEFVFFCTLGVGVQADLVAVPGYDNVPGGATPESQVLDCVLAHGGSRVFLPPLAHIVEPDVNETADFDFMLRTAENIHQRSRIPWREVGQECMHLHRSFGGNTSQPAQRPARSASVRRVIVPTERKP